MDPSLLDADFGSESEDDNFNPAPAINSDDEEGEESETGEHLNKTKNTNDQIDENHPEIDGDDEEQDDAAGAAHDDDEDDDEEEDEDDEDAISGRARKRQKKGNQFIDDIAEVDDEDEQDDDEEEETAGFIAETHPDDIAELPVDAETDDRGHRELDRERERMVQLDAEQKAAEFKVKYGGARNASGAVIPRRLLLPSVEDPSIWRVGVKQGKEKEVIVQITNRVDERAHSSDPMPIISAFQRDGTMAGYIYVEALKQADISAALDDISNCYHRSKTLLINIKEMPDLLRVTKSKELQPGGYVRFKSGQFAGDLAQIEDVETNGLKASLRIIPRLDYGLNEDNNAPMIDGGATGEAAKRKRSGAPASVKLPSRPPQRLFSEVEAKKKHGKYLQSSTSLNKKQWTYRGDTYVNGFLIKDIKIKSLKTEDVKPTLEEVTKFTAGAEDGTENLDLTALAASIKKDSATDSYLPGDMVEVYEGEQQGVSGKAISVRGEIVTLNATEGELRGQIIEVPIKGLRKLFKEGDHVKVIGGSRYIDEVGMVVRIKDDKVTLLSDLNMQEFTVFSKDLRKASDSGVAGGLGRYDIHDLVQLDPATVACVTKVDRESLRVLDQNGSIRSMMPSQISNKIERRRLAVATDRNGSEIRHDDTVREVSGEQKQGVILHIHRAFLFLHNREQTENSGIFVTRATNVATVAAKGGRVTQGASHGPDLSRMNPALQRSGASNVNRAMPPPRSYGKDKAIGKDIHICKGAYKGLVGMVKDTTDDKATVELYAKSQAITVPKEFLRFKDAFGRSIDYETFTGQGRPSAYDKAQAAVASAPVWTGSRTPAGVSLSGGRTPAWAVGAPARTPAWAVGAPARTPAWAVGGAGARTPSWKQEQSGGRTPAWAAEGRQTVNPHTEGNRTSYGGHGGRTPAWDQGNRTSYGGNNGFSTAASPGDYGSGSKTPAYHAPPTPAAAAATPKFSGYAVDVPTPGGVPTPYSGQPETPAWGGDDGPHYEDGTPSP